MREKLLNMNHANNGWQPANTAPEEEKLLVWVDGVGHEMALKLNGKWVEYFLWNPIESVGGCKVTHWQHLPQGPAE